MDSGGLLILGGHSKVTVERSHFEGLSTKVGSALGVMGAGSVQVTDSTFANNGHRGTLYGGAVALVDSDSVSFVRCHFSGNQASIYGGAVSIRSEIPSSAASSYNLYFEKCVFSDNRVVPLSSCSAGADCQAVGGAMFIAAFKVTMLSCDFAGNTVTASKYNGGRGGAIAAEAVYSLGQRATSLIQAADLKFLANRVICDQSVDNCAGGAVNVDGAVLKIQDSLFKENNVYDSDVYTTVQMLGGAMCLSGSGSLVAINVTWLGNFAKAGGTGGALWIEIGGTGFVQSSLFDGNFVESSFEHGSRGGAIAAGSYVNLTVIDTTIRHNSAGLCSSPSASIQCLSGSGGGVNILTAYAMLRNVVFSSNTALSGQLDAGGMGGALTITSQAPTGPVVVDGCTFEKNAALGAGSYLQNSGAAGQGGAAMVQLSTPLFRNCVFRLNWVTAGGRASSAGGAVRILYSTGGNSARNGISQFHDCHFEANSACSTSCEVGGEKLKVRSTESGFGGAIAMLEGSAFIANSTFAENVVYR